MKSYTLPHIEALNTYALGEQPPEGAVSIKLNQNESPYPPSPKVLEALRTLGEEELRRYPDPTCTELRQVISRQIGVNPAQIFCGNGSSEIISLFYKVFIGPGGLVALTDPTFALYNTVAASFQASCITVPLRDDFTVDVDGLLASGAKAVVLVNPNAPTGMLIDNGELERLVRGFDGLVVIDEAYIDFSVEGATALPLLQQYDNLIVMRTFSKAFALCGARVGYCAASNSLITALEKGRDIYNVNAISRKLAIAALKDTAYSKWTIGKTIQNRQDLIAKLHKLGFECLPSETNFILCKPPEKNAAGLTAKDIVEELTQVHIYVRHFNHPRIHDRIRISVGSAPEQEKLLAELERMLQLSASN